MNSVQMWILVPVNWMNDTHSMIDNFQLCQSSNCSLDVCQAKTGQFNQLEPIIPPNVKISLLKCEVCRCNLKNEDFSKWKSSFLYENNLQLTPEISSSLSMFEREIFTSIGKNQSLLFYLYGRNVKFLCIQYQRENICPPPHCYENHFQLKSSQSFLVPRVVVHHVTVPQQTLVFNVSIRSSSPVGENRERDGQTIEELLWQRNWDGGYSTLLDTISHWFAFRFKQCSR